MDVVSVHQNNKVLTVHRADGGVPPTWTPITIPLYISATFVYATDVRSGAALQRLGVTLLQLSRTTCA